MDLKTARIWQDVLFGAARWSPRRRMGISKQCRRTHRSYDDGRFAHRLVALYRCPKCGEHLGRGTTEALPALRYMGRKRTGARAEEEKFSTRKRNTERRRRPQ